jgi:hypothetical protein
VTLTNAAISASDEVDFGVSVGRHRNCAGLKRLCSTVAFQGTDYSQDVQRSMYIRLAVASSKAGRR